MDRGEELLQEAGVDQQQEKIFVSVRLRPLNEKEILRNDLSDWECINDTTIICRNSLSASERSMYPPAYTFGEKGFTFSGHYANKVSTFFG